MNRGNRIGQLLERFAPASENPLGQFISLALWFAMFGMACSVLVYYLNFHQLPISQDPAHWGQIGDFFGGILNPLFGFLSMFALLMTLALQNRELRLSRESLKVSQDELKLTREEQAKAAEALKVQNVAIQKQSFEQTFFAWLGTYRDALGDVRLFPDASGRIALLALWQGVLSEELLTYAGMVSSHPAKPPLVKALESLRLDQLARVAPSDYSVVSKAALDTWQTLYRKEANQLGSLFRVLYRLILWVDRQKSLSFDEKREYVSIVRAHLSWIELVFLFYNGLTPLGERFKPLVNRYALFDNLDPNSDRILAIVNECPPDSQGYAKSAFSSDLAWGTALTEPGLPANSAVLH